ncbi:hypothetical protein BOX15_Mlig032832g2, partial [Macrostomum lignano]
RWSATCASAAATSRRWPTTPPPPPPPPGVPGAPPPPPPPGGLAGFLGFNKPPALPHGLKSKPDYQLANPTKRLNWQAVNPRELSKDSIWVQIGNAEQEFSDPQLVSQLGELFSTKPPPKKLAAGDDGGAGGGSGAGGGGKSNNKKTKECRVLDPKSAQNLAITLGSLRLSFEEIKRRIVECDEERLSLGQVELLLKSLPEPSDMKKISALKVEYDDLAEPEQFLHCLAEVKNARNRLESLQFKLQFSDQLEEVKPSFMAVTDCLKVIRTSQRFKQVILAILTFGNIMNAGSRNQKSLGFDITFLTKLTGTKDTENKRTLMNVLVETLESKSPDVLNFPEDFELLDQAARVTEESLDEQLRDIVEKCKRLGNDLKSFKPVGPTDRFQEAMEPFHKQVKDQIDILQSLQKQMKDSFKEVSEYLTFNPAKYHMEDLLADLKTFRDKFQEAKVQNEEMRRAQERIAKAKEEKERREREKAARQQRQLGGPVKGGGGLGDDGGASANEDEGLVDNLLEALKSGKAFQTPGRTRAKRTPRQGAERRAHLARATSRGDLSGGGVLDAVVKELAFDDTPEQSKVAVGDN